MRFSRSPHLFVLALASFGIAGPLLAAQLDVMDIPGTTLRDNPLGDPAARHVAVFKPENKKDDAPMPLIIYLPGWGSSSEDALKDGAKSWFGSVVDQLSKAV